LKFPAVVQKLQTYRDMVVTARARAGIGHMDGWQD